ncbi:hypothetical protein HPB50_000291 [Hyalomma asiaticum]|uniref:Uncharacterized protein n=1 Tax=Hyalomma asiaticum TaxID=266040 RepID=A0ACB7RUE1_HYAAI|nr:hypothetical protein HPB50_000291 [Hyalomma asiaticum]
MDTGTLYTIGKDMGLTGLELREWVEAERARERDLRAQARQEQREKMELEEKRLQAEDTDLCLRLLETSPLRFTVTAPAKLADSTLPSLLAVRIRHCTRHSTVSATGGVGEVERSQLAERKLEDGGAAIVTSVYAVPLSCSGIVAVAAPLYFVSRAGEESSSDAAHAHLEASSYQKRPDVWTLLVCLFPLSLQQVTGYKLHKCRGDLGGEVSSFIHPVGREFWCMSINS